MKQHLAATPAGLVTQFAGTTYILNVPAKVEHIRGMETASNYDVFDIAPGRYPVRLINLNGSPWNPNPDVPTPGYTANNGPYYVSVTVDATHTQQHVVDRLLGASRAQDSTPNVPARVTEPTYAYTVQDGARGPFKGSTFQAVRP